MQQHSGMKKI